MSVFHINHFSNPIGMHCQMIVILPDGPGPFPMVYQLHGRSDDHTAWQRWTTIERHAGRLGVGIVLLYGARSFYCDTPGTNQLWERHIIESVAFVDRTFRTVPDTAGRGIGGLSMGGYGALKIALAHPELFGSAASHSGSLDVAAWVATPEGRANPDFDDIWPGRRVPARDDVRKLLAAKGRKPAIYIDCGTEDFLLEYNRTVKADLVRRGIPHIYLEYPGSHSWDYWQAHIGEALDFHAAHFRRALSPTPAPATAKATTKPKAKAKTRAKPTATRQTTAR